MMQYLKVVEDYSQFAAIVVDHAGVFYYLRFFVLHYLYFPMNFVYQKDQIVLAPFYVAAVLFAAAAAAVDDGVVFVVDLFVVVPDAAAAAAVDVVVVVAAAFGVVGVVAAAAGVVAAGTVELYERRVPVVALVAPFAVAAGRLLVFEHALVAAPVHELVGLGVELKLDAVVLMLAGVQVLDAARGPLVAEPGHVAELRPLVVEATVPVLEPLLEFELQPEPQLGLIMAFVGLILKRRSNSHNWYYSQVVKSASNLNLCSSERHEQDCVRRGEYYG